MKKNIVISLFDYTGNIVKPWSEAVFNANKEYPCL